jgi:hypothetical protein
VDIEEVIFRFGHEGTLSLTDRRISDLSLLVEGNTGQYTGKPRRIQAKTKLGNDKEKRRSNI